jgi:hypothetical protein
LYSFPSCPSTGLIRAAAIPPLTPVDNHFPPCRGILAGESVANLADVVGTAFGIALAKANLPVLPTFAALSVGYLIASRWVCWQRGGWLGLQQWAALL